MAETLRNNSPRSYVTGGYVRWNEVAQYSSLPPSPCLCDGGGKAMLLVWVHGGDHNDGDYDSDDSSHEKGEITCLIATCMSILTMMTYTII